MNNLDNHHVFSINTICNYDKDITYLKMDVGTYLIRSADGKYIVDDQSEPIHMMK